MKLLKLILRNFKGVKEFELTPNGSDTDVFGDMGTGKTTLADAPLWLLTGKDSANRADFNVKTLDKDNNPISGLSHEVEALFLMADGTEKTLTRCYEEQWTKKKGHSQAVFTGHSTGYHIDGVPVKKGEFDAFVASIADEETLRLLSDPLYFNTHFKWTDRRQTLLDVCGDVTDADVIASDPELADLPIILGKHTLDNYRKIITSRRGEINKELTSIPVRIDEVMRGLTDAEGDEKALTVELSELQQQRSKKLDERSRIESGGEVAELRKRMAEQDVILAEIRAKARDAAESAVAHLRTELNRIDTELFAKNSVIRKLQSECDAAEEQIKSLPPRMEQLRQKWHNVDDETFTHTHDDTCPTCNQSLPADQIEEAHKAALAAFNERKSTRLADISAQGKQLNEALAKHNATFDRCMAELETATAELANLQARYDALKKQIADTNAKAPDATSDPDYKAAEDAKASLAQQIDAIQSDKQAELDRVAGEIKAIDTSIAELQTALSKFDAQRRDIARIDELKNQERKLSMEFERIERELYLAELFVRAKVSLLEERINSKFSLARFKLFRELVNGGVEECCETLLNGVPWGDINGGGKIQVGLDIINTLAEHYGFAPPVWIDDAVTITDIPATRGQQIRLVVSKKDKKLRVVTSADAIKEAV